MRINRGIYKGRILKGTNIDGTRPTMDRVKESLFAMIQDQVKGSTCLDLFAGSGSLGIEALSMEGKFVYFVDNNTSCINTINDNLRSLNISNKYEVIKTDYKMALEYFVKNNIKFNLIFLDPPYKYEVIEEILKYIETNNLLEEEGMIICEYSVDKLKEEYNSIYRIKHKKYKDKYISIYKYI